uniref:Uncharacterized protein n=1 Tax=Magallana gigas TaxID=29159 RepID=K1R5M7_MAGGI
MSMVRIYMYMRKSHDLNGVCCANYKMVEGVCQRQEIDIINPQSSSNDSPLRELTSMHCGTTSPLSVIIQTKTEVKIPGNPGAAATIILDPNS